MSPRLLLASGVVAVALTVSGCAGNPVDGFVEGLVGSGRELVQREVDRVIDEVLPGAGVSTDGQLPPGFPSESVPLTGEIQGGGSGPDGTGWVVRTRLGSAAEFAAAQSALEGAGYASSDVSSDADSAAGTFISTEHRVLLLVSTEGDAVYATYVVTAV